MAKKTKTQPKARKTITSKLASTRKILTKKMQGYFC